ncbi:MAG TPA: acyltransferase [Solirubrobacteraceae bacterium]|jgi:acetyltransferase-like isoleucine patch superfamily enzyme|nr:acyltransferase [Solirubrobacteraceae bacterium]
MNVAALHTLYRDARDRAFSLAVRSSFESFGPRSRISLPAQLQGTERIAIGDHVYFGPGCWLLTHELEGAAAGRIEIGDRTSIAGYCVLSAAVSVSIGEAVLFARNVYIADHRHGFERADRAVLDQPIEDLRPVVVEDGAWLGQNVVLLPGVRIGKGAVVGAGSVVREDVPPRCVTVGSPARVLRRLDA